LYNFVTNNIAQGTYSYCADINGDLAVTLSDATLLSSSLDNKVWCTSWLAGCAALAVLASPSRQMAGFLRHAVQSRLQRLARERADARMWAAACSDPRVMSDLRVASQREFDPASAPR
jgi:hypothetical protein